MIDAVTAPIELPSLDHLARITGPAGITQFCVGDTPDETSGTCVDDNARAWLAAMLALAVDGAGHAEAREIGDRAFAFMRRAQLPDGAFHNFADKSGRFIDDIGSEASIGRSVWACGVAARCADVAEWRAGAIEMLEPAIDAVGRLTEEHARAYAVLGLAAAIAPEAASPLPARGRALPDGLRDRATQALIDTADALHHGFHAFASDDWSWWTEDLTWGNARLPESMLRAAAALGHARYASTGMRALQFLAEITQPEDIFIPIGNDGWYVRGHRRAFYDQQPIEACGMVDMWLAAHRLTGEPSHLRRARTAHEWFHGANTERIPVALPGTGGCCDGLLRGRLNANQGAESTLSYVHAALALHLAS